MFQPKPLPPPSVKLLFFPSHDTEYVHFERSIDLPFPSDQGYSLVHAWWLADAALLAYWPPEQVPATFARAGFINTQFFTHGSTQCYVASNPHAAIVSFRGTEITHLEDSLADAKAKLVRWDGAGRVHQGFSSALDAVWDPLRVHLQSLGSRAISFTGHSLGASLATLAARRWRNLRVDSSVVYTIGSPRVGDEAFAADFDAAFPDQCFRYVNGVDGVTQVPPPEFGFTHVGKTIPLGGNGSAHPFLAGLEAAFIDHTPRRYATLIWNQLVASVEESVSAAVVTAQGAPKAKR